MKRAFEAVETFQQLYVLPLLSVAKSCIRLSCRLPTQRMVTPPVGVAKSAHAVQPELSAVVWLYLARNVGLVWGYQQSFQV